MGIQGKTTRLSLIGRLGNKADQEAWFEFVEIYEPLVLNMAVQSGVQHSDAKEITQEVLTKVLISIDARDHENASGSFRGWLYRITRNMTIDFLRRSKRRNQSLVTTDLEQLVDPSLQDSTDFHMEFERQLFRWASDKVKSTVTETNWQAFWSTTVEGEAIPQAALRLGVSTGAIHVARSRIMSRISGMIQSRLEETQRGA